MVLEQPVLVETLLKEQRQYPHMFFVVRDQYPHQQVAFQPGAYHLEEEAVGAVEEAMVEVLLPTSSQTAPQLGGVVLA
jgi:hypothetical protein